MDALVTVCPPTVESGVVAAEAETGHVVAKCIPPDVDDLVGVARDRDTPAPGAALGAGNGEITQAAGDQAEDLVAARGRFDPQPIAGNQLMQGVGIAGQTEEPVLLCYQLGLGAVLGTAAVHKVLGGVELLAADAVAPFVVHAVQVTRGGAPLPQPLYPGAVTGIAAGADEVVERQR